YKKMQSLVSEGDLYRVENPYESNFFGFCIVSKDKSHAHLTMFKRLCGVNNETKVIYPKGLCENKKYYIKELDMTLSGNTIMNVGFVPNFPRGDFQTLTYTFEEK
ncbi:MAG: GH36 C-terminal domain-containing protein, partial [Clostridia bacterium]|nr:GH36 C-terminal domain-containing protein [Clostridia bacterium]